MSTFNSLALGFLFGVIATVLVIKFKGPILAKLGINFPKPPAPPSGPAS